MADNYSIIVTTKLKPGLADEFRPHVLKNAEITARTDENCIQFQVFNDPSAPEIFHYVEVYTNEAALAAHREDEHVQAFFAATNDMVAEKTVRTCMLLNG